MTNTPPTDVLNYAGPRPLQPLPPVVKAKWFLAVLVCMIVPLVIGLTIFGMARHNRQYEEAYKYDSAELGPAPPRNAADRRRHVLEIGGVLDILCGCVATLVGLGCVIAFAVERSCPAPNRFTGLVVPVVVMLCLLASNFVVAFFCLEAVG